MTRHVKAPAVTAAPASATPISRTSTVGVPGQVWAVRPRARLMIQCSPNAGTWRPARAGGDPGREPGQPGAMPQEPQPISSTTQTPAPLPAMIGTRGPAARLMAGSPLREVQPGWT